jgi:hypothetical protein
VVAGPRISEVLAAARSPSSSRELGVRRAAAGDGSGGRVPCPVALVGFEAAPLVDAGGVAELPAEPVLVAEPVLPLVAFVAQLEQLGERLRERDRFALAWDNRSRVSGSLACGSSCFRAC